MLTMSTRKKELGWSRRVRVLDVEKERTDAMQLMSMTLSHVCVQMIMGFQSDYVNLSEKKMKAH